MMASWLPKLAGHLIGHYLEMIETNNNVTLKVKVLTKVCLSVQQLTDCRERVTSERSSTEQWLSPANRQ